MEGMPEELLLKIISYLPVSDRFQLSVVSTCFRRLINESWQDYAVMLKWTKANENQTWLDTCKRYFEYRKRWFSGKFWDCKIYFESSNYRRSQNILSSLARCENLIGVGTDKCLSCFNVLYDENTNHFQNLKGYARDMEVAANSLCISNSHVCAIDNLTSELVVTSMTDFKEYRSQLRFNLVCDFCHMTQTHIIILADTGEIFLYCIEETSVICIHDEDDEVSFSTVYDEWHLVVCYWSGKLITFNLFSPKKPIISLALSQVMYSTSLLNSCLYFGTADGGVGCIKLNYDNSMVPEVHEFEQKHSASVYCVATNNSVLVSGGADSKVVFWNLHGSVLFIDHMSHVGVVRHIFLNEWLMITAGDAHVLIIWDPINLAIKHVFHHNPLKIKFMLANEKSLVYGSPDANYIMFLSISV